MVQIAWCGVGRPLIGGGDAGQVRACGADELRDCGAELVVLESGAFETLEGCRRVCLGVAGPVLLIVAAEELGEVLGWLREQDDVCLSGSPSALVAHRIERLAGGAGDAVDPLTGALGRARFNTLVERRLRDASGERPVSLILADLDHFKAVNDRHGHAVGDQVLQRCGAILRRICASGSVAARFGGEEFAVLTHDGAPGALELAERIRTEFGIAADSLPRVTLSLGVVTVGAALDAELLFRRADEALYAAKARGRNVTVSYAEVESASIAAGDDIELTGLQNRARVWTERVTNSITLRSKRLFENLRAEAETDGLTQFYTRRSLDRRLKAELDGASHGSGRLAVALIDLDHFGQINKTHGWPTGDKVLREVCDVIRGNLRSTDWVGRYGGEEFCVVMPQTSLHDACAVLERMRLAVEAAPFRSTSGEEIRVTLSIGVVAHCGNGVDPVELLERVSGQALKAKRAGRNRLFADGVETVVWE